MWGEVASAAIYRGIQWRQRYICGANENWVGDKVGNVVETDLGEFSAASGSGHGAAVGLPDRRPLQVVIAGSFPPKRIVFH